MDKKMNEKYAMTDYYIKMCALYDVCVPLQHFDSCSWETIFYRINSRLHISI